MILYYNSLLLRKKKLQAPARTIFTRKIDELKRNMYPTDVFCLDANKDERINKQTCL